MRKSRIRQWYQYLKNHRIQAILAISPWTRDSMLQCGDYNVLTARDGDSALRFAERAIQIWAGRIYRGPMTGAGTAS
jgi:hypothetical protein